MIGGPHARHAAELAPLALALAVACASRGPSPPARSFDTAGAAAPPAAAVPPPATTGATTEHAPPAPAPPASAEPALNAAPAPVGPAPPPTEQRLAELRETYSAPRHRPSLLDEPARPARVAPGRYRCAVSREYRLRTCLVEKDDAGRTLLTVEEGNLIAVRGVLYDDGPVVRFEGWLTEQRPFGCFTCQERCFVDPSGCVCQELAAEASRRCVGQPMKAELRGAGAHWRGPLHHTHYWNRYEGDGPNRHVVGYETTAERYELRLEGRSR
ncbi:MAG: hypothetical protein IT376_22125 [Polyangiaceae bacterium]|nr:hypothetical protein [Polyangiaceae bacterium]